MKKNKQKWALFKKANACIFSRYFKCCHSLFVRHPTHLLLYARVQVSEVLHIAPLHSHRSWLKAACVSHSSKARLLSRTVFSTHNAITENIHIKKKKMKCCSTLCSYGSSLSLNIKCFLSLKVSSGSQANKLASCKARHIFAIIIIQQFALLWTRFNSYTLYLYPV